MKEKILFNRYIINQQGKLLDTKSKKEIKYHNNKAFLYNGVKRKNYTLKTLYYMAFKENFCIDNIQNLDGEEWKHIDIFNGFYYISNYGRIKSKNRYNSILLSQETAANGYKRITIKKKHYKVHRLVALYFLENDNPTEKKEVHHKDYDRLNNKAVNLEWIEPSKHRKMKKPKGKQNDDNK